MRITLIGIVLLMGELCWAASGGGHGGHGDIPVKFILSQTFNVVLFVALLIYLARHKVKDVFRERHASFHQLMQKAQSARKDAEVRKQEIKDQLHRLENQSQDNLARAKKEAKEIRSKILNEAEEMAERLKKDAYRVAEFECEKAKQELREEVLEKSLEISKETLKDKVQAQDQKRLQTEFVEKFEVVR